MSDKHPENFLLSQFAPLVGREIKHGAHHAYIVNSDCDIAQQFVDLFLQRLNCLNPNGDLPCFACPICQANFMAKLVITPEKEIITIDQIRDGANFLSSTNLDIRLRYKGLIIVEAHKMSASDHVNRVQENALLKTLEEPPPGSIIFLLTNQPSFFLPTILSRTARLDLRFIINAEYQKRLQDLQLNKNEILLLMKIGDTELDTSEDVEFAINAVKIARGLATKNLERSLLYFYIAKAERWQLMLRVFRVYLHDLLLFNQIGKDEKIYKLVPCNTYVIVDLLQMIATLELTLSTTRSNPKFQLLSLLSKQHCRIG